MAYVLLCFGISVPPPSAVSVTVTLVIMSEGRGKLSTVSGYCMISVMGLGKAAESIR